MDSEKKILRVVGCIIKHDSRMLMLFRSETETDPSLWGIPAGKVEEGETDLEAIIREVFEETGIQLEENQVEHLEELPIEYPNMTVVFPIFKVHLDEEAAVTLEPREHIDFGWISPDEVLKMPNLMKDVDLIVEKYAK